MQDFKNDNYFENIFLNNTKEDTDMSEDILKDLIQSSFGNIPKSYMFLKNYVDKLVENKITLTENIRYLKNNKDDLFGAVVYSIHDLIFSYGMPVSEEFKNKFEKFENKKISLYEIEFKEVEEIMKDGDWIPEDKENERFKFENEKEMEEKFLNILTSKEKTR